MRLINKNTKLYILESINIPGQDVLICTKTANVSRIEIQNSIWCRREEMKQLIQQMASPCEH